MVGQGMMVGMAHRGGGRHRVNGFISVNPQTKSRKQSQAMSLKARLLWPARGWAAPCFHSFLPSRQGPSVLTLAPIKGTFHTQTPMSSHLVIFCSPFVHLHPELPIWHKSFWMFLLYVFAPAERLLGTSLSWKEL